MRDSAKNRLKTVGIATAVLAAAAAIVMLVLGGYSPFYKAFLRPPPAPGYAEFVQGIEGIDYVARVNDGLYRGAYPRDALEQLKGLGIRAIINFRYLEMHDYGEEARALGFEYHWMPINPGEPPSAEDIEKFLAIVTDPSKQPVYIHCTAGIDRTGLMTGIYRLEIDGWTNEQAVAEMEFFGHNELWIDLEENLKSYVPVRKK